MLSQPATGTTRIAATRGDLPVAFTLPLFIATPARSHSTLQTHPRSHTRLRTTSKEKTSMNRRQFLVSSGAAGVLASTGIAPKQATAAPTASPERMKLGDQTAPTNDTHLKYLARYGVRNICGYPQIE